MRQVFVLAAVRPSSKFSRTLRVREFLHTSEKYWTICLKTLFPYAHQCFPLNVPKLRVNLFNALAQLSIYQKFQLCYESHLGLFKF